MRACQGFDGTSPLSRSAVDSQGTIAATSCRLAVPGGSSYMSRLPASAGDVRWPPVDGRPDAMVAGRTPTGRPPREQVTGGGAQPTRKPGLAGTNPCPDRAADDVSVRTAARAGFVALTSTNPETARTASIAIVIRDHPNSVLRSAVIDIPGITCSFRGWCRCQHYETMANRSPGLILESAGKL